VVHITFNHDGALARETNHGRRFHERHARIF